MLLGGYGAELLIFWPPEEQLIGKNWCEKGLKHREKGDDDGDEMVDNIH